MSCINFEGQRGGGDGEGVNLRNQPLKKKERELWAREETCAV